MTRDELRDEFEKAAREAINEADFVDAETAREIVDKRLRKADVEEDPDEEGTAESVDDGDSDVLDRLEDEGVPQDLIDACAEYVAKAGVEKALDVNHTDPHLARQLEENEAVLSEQIDKTQERQDAIAEAVAEGEPDAEILDAVVYDDEEGV